MRDHRGHGDNWMKLNPHVLVILILLPCFSIQELSQLSAASPGDPVQSTGPETFREALVFPKETDNVHARPPFGRLVFPQDSSSNVSLKELADDIGRLEGNLASLIQSFLALQRSVFNLEQLQELLVLLLEDILKQTGNTDRSAKDMDQTTGSSSASADSKTDDGVDSAEIDETGEDTGDDDDNNNDAAGDDGDDRNNNLDDRSTRDAGGGGGGGDKKGQGGTNPFHGVSEAGTPLEANRRLQDGNPNTENQQQQHRRFVNRISKDSDGSSEGRASGSAEEEGGASGGTNAILSKGIPSNANKVPPASPRKPQLSEPMMSSSAAQLEARLNDMIQRLSPGIVGQHSPQQLAHIRASSRGEWRPSHLGESPLAPRPIFEPLEILTDGKDNSAPTGSKTAIGSQSVSVKQRMAVVSHGGPLVGPEDFTSPFMERLDGMSNKGNSLNERSTGMISNLMQKEQVSVSNLETSGLDIVQKTQDKTPITSSFAKGDYIPSTIPTAPTTTSDDFDQIIATLLEDLDDHLRKQHSQHEVSSRTSDVIDQAVTELSKLTWIQKPTQNHSSMNPEYSVHIAAQASSSHKEDASSNDDQNTTIVYRAESNLGRKGNVKTEDSQGVTADQILSTHVPRENSYHLSIQTADVHEEDQIKSTAQPLDTTAITPTGRNQISTLEPRYANDGSQSVMSTHRPWDWLRYFKWNNANSDASLTMLIELLSELSSERHNISKQLAEFSSRGQKIIENEMQLQNSTSGISFETDGTGVHGEYEQPGSEILKDLESGDIVSEEVGSESADSSEDEDLKYMEKTLDGKRPSDHPNSLFGGDNYKHEDSNSVGGYNETDSSSSEEHEEDDYFSRESASSESEDDDDEFNQTSYPTGSPTQDNREQNNAPRKLASTKPTGKVYIKHYEQTQQDRVNEVVNTKHTGKISDKNPRTEINYDLDHLKKNSDSLYEDDSDSEEDKSYGSESNDNDYYGAEGTEQETQLYSPPMQDGQSEEIPHNEMPSLSVFGNHIITKRNIQQSKIPGILTLKNTRTFQQPEIIRKKRQAANFWHQLLGYGSNPMGQQGSSTNQGLQSHGGFQGHANPQGQSGLQGRDPPHSLGQQQSQTGFHQTPFQTPNQQNLFGLPQGQSPLQYPVPPFRGYPHYSRYGNYLGLNYPHFGYPGYPGMNHEPGESPSFESGPSADVMEEVLNGLFQRYWENVRNMFTVKGPSAAPENEYEGPITTTTTTTAAPTTTTVATTTTKATTTRKLTTIPQPLNKTTTATTMPSVEVTNTTINATAAVNSTETQIPEVQSAVGQADLRNSTSLNSMAQIFHRRETGKNTALPPNFFQRKPLTKTSPFPLF